MRTTISVDDSLLEEAKQLTGESKVSALVTMGLKSLVERQAALRLAMLGGSDTQASAAPRNR